MAADETLSDTARIARDLIRFDTTNWGEGRSRGETEAAEYVGAILESLGLDIEYVDAAERRTSVIARVEGSYANPVDTSRAERPGLVVHGHLDVVPADPANWSVDPFGGEIRDGLLWGRGAVDMKNMDAMMLTALTEILSSGRQPNRDLTVAFFSDEENGGTFGSHHLVTHRPELFAGATEAISEVGGYSVEIGGKRAYLLQTGEKALVWIRLRARGTAAHGSRDIPNNAVTKLAEAVVTLGREQWPLHLTDTTRQLLAEIARLLDADPEQTGPDELLLRTGTAAGFLTATLRTTSNPTLLSAGYKHNVIPDTAEALIDIRTLPGEEEGVLARVRELIGDEIELEIVTQDVGLENPFEGPIVDAMVGTLLAHDPEAQVLPYLLSGGTDNKALSELGITGYGFAPLKLTPELDFPAMFHGVDERVPLDALDFGHRALTDFLLNY
ncbi:acetylornithine deacetylase/succinyl-diaminopimelate desuccinylase-like protein [Microcella putealis]|uniref:Acetylornithine deacetylase/succinyl-diaminopimelate desuccinylase-like protein n=1 Tax=Microcella putealis TaxID=337005 RepID=A0A4Q7LWR2_9MICO|nr:M20/M25/M40 family metallo-hydrolase [Microcella putealis]RZS58902.1 acetylornithine deacetylase/succinyl-diaminopimelate desuccinylase-like protein [Microcella putealis]TQM23928.1 acetylornithine deacetylase/succinyl-diaminopimelate desuccinylase-like protein [Microcella putealis]